MPETFSFEKSSFSMYFDDLHEGMSFTSPGRTICETDVVMFSHMTGDRHSVHTDAEWAATSQFGSRIANGLLVVSYAFGLLPLDPERVVAMRSINRAVFRRPVHLGDTITVRGTITRLKDLHEEFGLVGCGLEIRNQHHQRTTIAEVELVWNRAPL